MYIPQPFDGSAANGSLSSSVGNNESMRSLFDSCGLPVT